MQWSVGSRQSKVGSRQSEVGKNVGYALRTVIQVVGNVLDANQSRITTGAPAPQVQLLHTNRRVAALRRGFVSSRGVGGAAISQ